MIDNHPRGEGFAVFEIALIVILMTIATVAVIKTREATRDLRQSHFNHAPGPDRHKPGPIRGHIEGYLP